MRKLFGNKRKKSTDDFKPGNLKIPVPMISGIEYADLPESQIATIIGGGNYAKKSTSSKPSSLIEKTPQFYQQQPIVPSRSISSPPILLMPKPHYGVPPTRFILKNINFEKTQIEDNSDTSSDSEDDENRVIQEIYPSNITTSSKPNTIKRSVLVTSTTEAQDKSPILNEKNSSQSTGFITRTSDDSTRQYISASESPFFTASSVVSNKMSASGTTTTPTVTSLQQTIYQPTPAHQNTKTPEKQTNNKEFILTPKENTTFTSNNTISSIPKPQQGSSAYEVNLQDFPKPPPSLPGPSKSDEPLLKKSSNVPLVMPIPTKKKTSSRPPTSSSGSSATVGHDVTHASVNGYINNNDKPPENIVSPAFLSQNSNKNTMSQAVNTVDAYTSIQELLKREMKKMALNEDLQELKRAVEQMQQDRLLDLQENSTRFEQQKLTDIAMWEHINMANEKLSKLIQDAEAMQKQKHSTEEPKTATPTLKSSNSTNTTRTNRSRASSNEFTEAPRTSQRQKSNRRSFPAVPNNPRLMNDYFPDMKDRPPEFDFMMVQQYPPYAFYPPTQEYEEARFGDPYQESPRSRRSGRQQRSKSMDPPQWVPAEMMDERNPYLPFPPPDQQMRPMFMDMPPRTLSRKSSFHSAKSDDDEPNTNKNDKNGGKQRPHDSGVDDRMRRRYRPPMIPLDDNGLPPMYSNGTAPGAFGPLPPHFAMEPPYGYPPPPGNEYFSYMSPRMMFDEQEQNNGQQKLPQKQPPPQQQQQVWGSNPGTPFWGYALPPHQKQEHKLKEGSLRRNGKTTQQAMPVRYPMYADALHF